MLARLGTSFSKRLSQSLGGSRSGTANKESSHSGGGLRRGGGSRGVDEGGGGGGGGLGGGGKVSSLFARRPGASSTSEEEGSEVGDGGGAGRAKTSSAGDDDDVDGDEGESGESKSDSELPVANRFAALAGLGGESSWRREQSRFKQDFVKVGKPLGKGGFGRVYRARNKLDGIDYAVKVVHIMPGQDVAKILREVNALSRMHHENIVRYYNA